MGIVTGILQLILAIPKIFELISSLIKSIEQASRERVAEDRKKAIDETTKTGDQRKEEESFGGVSGKPSDSDVAGDLGLQRRPVRDRN